MVKHQIGVYKENALFARYDKMDLDYCRLYGFYVYAANGCSIKNSHIAVQNDLNATYGVYIDNNDSDYVYEVLIADNYIVAYAENHSDSVGIACPIENKRGVKITGNEIKCLSPEDSKFLHGIYINRTRDFQVLSNTIYPDASSSAAIYIDSGERFNVSKNLVINHDIDIVVGASYPYTIEDNACTNLNITQVGAPQSFIKTFQEANYNRILVTQTGEWDEGYLKIGDVYLWWDGSNLMGKKSSAPTSASDGTAIF